MYVMYKGKADLSTPFPDWRSTDKFHTHKIPQAQLAEELRIFLRDVPKSKVGVLVAMCR